MLTILIIIGAVLLLLAVIFVIVWKVRTHKFSPTSDKALLAANVNADLKETGFAYDMKAVSYTHLARHRYAWISRTACPTGSFHLPR